MAFGRSSTFLQRPDLTTHLLALAPHATSVTRALYCSLDHPHARPLLPWLDKEEGGEEEKEKKVGKKNNHLVEGGNEGENPKVCQNKHFDEWVTILDLCVHLSINTPIHAEIFSNQNPNFSII